MPLGVTCDCALCSIEVHLLSDLYCAEPHDFDGLFSASRGLRQFSSVATLLSHLKTSPADAGSDRLLRELFAARTLRPAFIETLLVLTFVPMLHSTIRRVARQQLSLSPEDITQQALTFLLQFLRSNELRARQSHFAFAISRAVKRRLFEWAHRESGNDEILNHYNGESLAALAVDEPFERYALLRHFLYRCYTKGLLTDAELNLLIEFKLNGNNGEDLAGSNGTSSNALRQRLKRLLTKLRRLAQ